MARPGRDGSTEAATKPRPRRPERKETKRRLKQVSRLSHARPTPGHGGGQGGCQQQQQAPKHPQSSNSSMLGLALQRLPAPLEAQRCQGQNAATAALNRSSRGARQRAWSRPVHRVQATAMTGELAQDSCVRAAQPGSITPTSRQRRKEADQQRPASISSENPEKNKTWLRTNCHSCTTFPNSYPCPESQSTLSSRLHLRQDKCIFD